MARKNPSALSTLAALEISSALLFLGYLAAKKKPSVAGKTCPEGQVWSKDKNKCVVVEEPAPGKTCPEGYIWNVEQQKCVPRTPPKPDEPNPPPPTTKDCPEGYIWDEEEQACVLESGPELEPPTGAVILRPGDSLHLDMAVIRDRPLFVELPDRGSQQGPRQFPYNLYTNPINAAVTHLSLGEWGRSNDKIYRRIWPLRSGQVWLEWGGPGGSVPKMSLYFTNV
jgi:hypothetical protein